MSRFLIREFLTGVSLVGVVIKKNVEPIDFRYQLPVANCHCRWIKKYMGCGDEHYIQIRRNIYFINSQEELIFSNAPFNVTGFTGDEDVMGRDAVSGISAQVYDIQTKIKSNLAWMLNYDDDVLLSPSKLAMALFKKWAYQAVDYIDLHLTYNLLEPLWADHALLDTSEHSLIWSEVLGYDEFGDIFRTYEDLSKLPSMLDFKKLLAHFEQAYISNNSESLAYANLGKTLPKSYLKRRLYAKHDVFVITGRGDLYEPIFHRYNKRKAFIDTQPDQDASIINQWLHAFNSVLIENGSPDIFHDFLCGFIKALDSDSYQGNTFECGLFKVRFCTDHVNVTVPNNISAMIGKFVSKYGLDRLMCLEAS